MRQRPLVLTIVALGVALFGGAGIGILLANWAAPGSHLALILGFLLLPAALGAGFHAWLGLAVIISAPRMIGRIARPSSPPAPQEDVTPPGAWSFLLVGSCFGLLGGAVTGLFFSSVSGLYSTLAFWAAGTAYGGALWRLARAGYLPFPESD